MLFELYKSKCFDISKNALITLLLNYCAHLLPDFDQIYCIH